MSIIRIFYAMNTIKKITAGIFLIIGISILLLGTIDLANPKATNKNKEGALAAIVLFSIPSTSLGAWIVWSLRQQHLKQVKQLNLEKEQLFLHLLQEHQGEITITQFALTAQISIEAAKLYLDEKAKQLNANFEANDDKGIVYKFPK
jgi:hypothetical protein